MSLLDSFSEGNKDRTGLWTWRNEGSGKGGNGEGERAKQWGQEAVGSGSEGLGNFDVS